MYKCLASTDGVRCDHEARYRGFCYYHDKMKRNLIQPTKDVGIVRDIENNILYINRRKRTQ